MVCYLLVRLWMNALHRSMVAWMPFLCVRSVECDAATPGPMSPTRMSFPALSAADPSEP